MAGHGIAVQGTYVGTYRASEYGIVMGLLSIMPKPAYEGRLDRQWIKRTRYDFYFPEFAHLSEQAIYNAEVNYYIHRSDWYFGFQGRYDEMRVKHDMVTGKFRSGATGSLSFWHCARYFAGTTPLLGQNFLVQGFNASDFASVGYGAKRILAVPSEPAFLVNWKNHVKAIRPLPVRSNPGLIDHF
jgi:hypothetical protein